MTKRGVLGPRSFGPTLPPKMMRNTHCHYHARRKETNRRIKLVCLMGSYVVKDLLVGATWKLTNTIGEASNDNILSLRGSENSIK